MPDVNALYPQPPAAPAASSSLLANPGQAIGLANGLNQLKLFNAQYPALAQQPAAALQGQNISNQSAINEQQAAASSRVRQVMSGYLAGIKNPTADDVRSAAALAARQFPDIAVRYPDIITSASAAAIGDPRGIKYGAGLLTNTGLSPESQSGLVAAPPNPETGPPRQQTVPESNLAGTRDTALPPGEQGLREAPVERASKLQSSAGTTMQYHADLENLRQASKDAATGPTAELEKKVNQLGQRFGIPVTMTAEQLAKTEEFDKIANQISLNQSTMFHGSDAGLHTVVGANPSTSMSRYGREGVIDMLQGNQDAIDTARKAWLRARAEVDPKTGQPKVRAQDFDTFMETLGQTLDPRVFQFNRMSRDNQQKFLDSMDADDIKDFEEKYQKAIDRKWVAPLKATSGGRLPIGR